MADPSTDGGATFHVDTRTEPAATVLAGFSGFGLAGLTAVDYLVDHLELEQTGHIRAEGLPTITPFQEGKPRYPTRLYSRSDLDVTVLVGELLVPVPIAEPFSNAILDWTGSKGVEEIAVLSGVPFPHGPNDHRAFYVASDDYVADHFSGDAAADVPPMGAGFLDGTNAALMARGMESDLGVGVYVTPVHALAPDVEATIRLLDAAESVYGLGIDTDPLQEFAEEVQQYYQNLADRFEEQSEEEQPLDRMYM
ncbi:proteasome assembly chaperone family protein [Halorarum salinum]|uniref:Proteasome assembly chaperone family protein n=1 Tax=Halorarum salinum TaxID=2743089 RepID=A0A7D5QEB6_9EURY|nr:PAC2 family protein [Halobaculum salinum]QLG62761.1 proteasome assembly chaperone family protein [Halobaculum salinum]